MSKATYSSTLEQKAKLLKLSIDANANSKRHRAINYPSMEAALADWFTGHQERANMSGDLVCEATGKILTVILASSVARA